MSEPLEIDDYNQTALVRLSTWKVLVAENRRLRSLLQEAEFVIDDLVAFSGEDPKNNVFITDRIRDEIAAPKEETDEEKIAAVDRTIENAKAWSLEQQFRRDEE